MLLSINKTDGRETIKIPNKLPCGENENSYMRIRKLDCLNDSQSLGIAFAPARKELKRAVSQLLCWHFV